MQANFKRVKEIFLAAVETTSPDEREACLRAACGADDSLRRQVEALLRRHEDAGSFLESPVVAPAATDDSRPHDSVPPIRSAEVGNASDGLTETIGSRIGSYKLVQQLGEGGMGTVWLAEQTEPVKRHVALKLIKPGMDSAQVLRRFDAERQALALMDHSNIAKVLDAGSTAESRIGDSNNPQSAIQNPQFGTGRPYFVMELVKGVPITRYCDELRLSLGERLALFVPVCQAIQHAHQKGIIHRDIKPTNVLVAASDPGAPGVPKVIDFGVAKALRQRLTEESLHTDVGQIVGTLEYMSPEQAELSPLDIDTRADVYALGVLLYELLTGTTPLDRKRLKQAAYSEMLRMIREVEPPKPSTRLSELSRGTESVPFPAKGETADDAMNSTLPGSSLTSIAAMRRTEPARLAKELRGELDWIAMKCLEKDRTRRYESASDLARDVERYLRDETVEACPPSTRYRMGKFLRKHRAGVLTTAALLGLLLAGVAASTWQAVRATAAEVKARDKELEALAAAAAERTATKKALAAADAERTAKHKARQSIELLVGAVTEAELLKDGRFQPLRKKLLAGALRYYQEFIRDHEHDALARHDLAKALDQVGKINHESGSRDDARAAMARSLELWQSLAADGPANAEYQNGLARSHRNLGVLQRAMGERVAAVASFQSAVKIHETLAHDNPGDTEYQDALGWSYNNLGVPLAEAGDRAAALDCFRRAIAIRDKVVQNNPTVAKYRGRLAESYGNLGNLQRGAGDHAAALTSYRQAMAIQEKLVDENRTIAEYEADLGAACENLGYLSNEMGDRDRALASYQRALRIFDKLARENPTVSEYRRDLAGSFTKLGDSQRVMGDGAAALDSYQKAVVVLAKLVDENSTTVEYRRLLGNAQYRLAGWQDATGDRAAALASCLKAIEIQSQLVTENPAVTEHQIDLALSHDRVGTLRYQAGDGALALESYLRAHGLLESLVQQYPTDTNFQFRLGGTRCNLGNVESGSNTENALEWYRQAAAVLEGVVERDPSNANARLYLQNSHKGWGVVLGKLDRHAEAADEWGLALEFDDGNHAVPLRTVRAIALAKAGDHVRAAAEARELAADPQSLGVMYNLACVMGLSASAAKDDAGLTGHYAAEAVELLKRARQAGFFADAANVSGLSEDPDLEPLRERDDFRKLLEELDVAE